jgi:hypothetical protein
MNWKALKKEIDWDKVDSAIISADQENISTEVFKVAKNMVMDATEYFLPLDLKWFTIVQVEKEFEHTYGTLTDRGFIDLILKIKKTAGKPYSDYADEKILIDWKTTGGELNTTWRNYYIESWQWKRYSANEGNKLFEYRGISSKTNWDGNRFVSSCAPLILSVPDNNYENVEDDLLLRQKLRLALQNSTLYPRNMPSACFKFNEKCEFFDGCAAGTSKRDLIPLEVLNKTSYSSDETFLLCPEKYRLTKLTESRKDDFENSSGMGTLVHRGLAEIYLQFKEENA